ncbi:hypothetical protein ACSBR1_009486 [Camellia fascicularis]
MAVVVLIEEKNKRRDLKDFKLIKARSEGFKEHLIQIWGFRIRYVDSCVELQLKLIECALAKEKLAMSNVHLVMSIAQRYDNMGAEMADLIQVIVFLLALSFEMPISYTYSNLFNIELWIPLIREIALTPHVGWPDWTALGN